MCAHARFLVAFVLLGSSALFLQARGRGEIIPQRPPLSSFPDQLGAWAGSDVAMAKETLDVLGPGDFLLRVYRNQSQPQPYADLFIAYFPTQRTGDTIHSPKNCLPGAGWGTIYLVTDSIRMNRSDGSLVRMTTPMFAGESADAAMQRLLPFAQQVEPLLNQYIPQ